MKQMFAALAAAGVLTASLAGCGALPGAGPSAAISSPAASAQSPYGDGDFGSALSLSTEWPAYGPDVERIAVLAENQTGESQTLSGPYELEKQGSDGRWYAISRQAGSGETAAVETVDPHDTAAALCPMDGYGEILAPGEYRLIAEAGGKPCAAVFSVSGESRITRQTPCGFASLSALPADYSAAQAEADGCVVYPTGGACRGGSAADAFLAKLRLEIPCQLRLVRFTVEGAPVIEDVVYDPEGGFTWQRDDSRDGFSAQPGISQPRTFAHLVTDGWSLYLSDSAVWDAAGAEGQELLYGEDAAPYIAAVQALSDSAADAGTRP
jgi:hypothetical protein